MMNSWNSGKGTITKNASQFFIFLFFENHEMAGKFTKLVPETKSRNSGDHEF